VYITSQAQRHKYCYIRRYFMTVNVKVKFYEQPDGAFETELGNWIAEYVSAGNTGVFPGTGKALTLIREWDTVEHAQLYIDWLTTKPEIVESAEIMD
jgi:hypothetical protein